MEKRTNGYNLEEESRRSRPWSVIQLPENALVVLGIDPNDREEFLKHVTVNAPQRKKKDVRYQPE